MSKIAVVGCQASGKTVFMAALADYYRPNQRVNQLCCMTPENANANRFSELMIHQMRDLHEWPSATNAQRTMSLKWAMRRGSKILAQIEMLDFGGEVYRAAFREDENSPQNQDAVRQLVEYLMDANFIVVLVSLAELSRDINRTATEREVALDVESKWVTRGLLDLLREHQSAHSKVIVALTQADRPEHKQLLETYGSAKELFEKAWPTVSAVYPDLTVISVASVSNTTMDNRPAEGFKTDGVLSVMKEFCQHEFGDCEGLSQRLAVAAQHLCQMSAVRNPAAFTEQLNEFNVLLQQLYQNTAVVAELYKTDFQNYERIKATSNEFVNVIVDVERRPLEAQVNSSFWREQEQLYPALAGTIKGFERYYQRKVEQVKDEIRKKEEARLAEMQRAEEAAAREEAERQRRLRQAEEDRQLRIRLESEAAEKRKREQEEAERRAEVERIRRRDQLLAEKEEERLAAERSLREKKERDDKAKVFVKKMFCFAIILAVLATAFIVHWQMSANERAEENKRVLAARAEKERLDRIARDKQAEADRKLRAEQKEKERIEQERQAEEERKLRVAQEEKERVARERENKLQREMEERKAVEARKAKEAELELKKIEERERARERAEVERKEQAAREAAEQEAREKAAKVEEIESLIAEVKDAASEDDLDGLRAKLVRLDRLELSAYQKSVVKVCEAICQHLEKALNGNAESQRWIALQHAEQKTIVKQDYAVARKWYEKAAENGDVKSMLKLANWAEEGIGMIKDDSGAVKWYEQALGAGSGDAAYWLGVYYYRGEKGLKKSPRKAREMFMKAKRLGTSYTNVDEWIANAQVGESKTWW